MWCLRSECRREKQTNALTHTYTHSNTNTNTLTHTYTHPTVFWMSQIQIHSHTLTRTLRCFECKAKHEKCHNCFCCNDGLTEMCTKNATSFRRKSIFHFSKKQYHRIIRLLWSLLMLSTTAYCDQFFICPINHRIQKTIVDVFHALTKELLILTYYF